VDGAVKRFQSNFGGEEDDVYTRLTGQKRLKDASQHDQAKAARDWAHKNALNPDATIASKAQKILHRVGEE
jgi:hypothetical protein